MPALDDRLFAWPDLAKSGPWSDLLIGNGASQAVWPDFGYPSLYEKAQLDEDDRELFRVLGTRNFELVLDRLRLSRIVCRQLGHAIDAIDARYEGVRAGLLDAVRQVHVPWGAVPEWLLDHICENLAGYDHVFTTNYDLLAYWAIMRSPGRFADYFWSDLTFDATNTHGYLDRTKVLYLHGALHLYRLAGGEVVKRKQLPGQNLLDAIGTDYLGADTPMFVSEGTAEDKAAAIRRCDYLSFGLEQLATPDRKLVVFGHSLSDQDKHLVAAIRRRQAPLAISIRPSVNVISRKAELQSLLLGKELLFFDATTHPLGDSRLHPSGDDWSTW
jgi:hypothetical protein